MFGSPNCENCGSKMKIHSEGEWSTVEKVWGKLKNVVYLRKTYYCHNCHNVTDVDKKVRTEELD
jgi:hypothetical protein